MAKEYIEREALLRYLNDIWLTATPTDTMPDDDMQLSIVRCMGLNDAMDAVKDAPAADVVPARHGRWVLKDDGRAHCSMCDTSGNSNVWNYCPACGARMNRGTICTPVKEGDGE